MLLKHSLREEHGLSAEKLLFLKGKAYPAAASIRPYVPVQRVSKNDPSLKQALEILHLAVGRVES
jgi:hypothetical protein